MLHSRWCWEHLKRQNTGTSLSLPPLLYKLLINIYLINVYMWNRVWCKTWFYYDWWSGDGEVATPHSPQAGPHWHGLVTAGVHRHWASLPGTNLPLSDQVGKWAPWRVWGLSLLWAKPWPSPLLPIQIRLSFQLSIYWCSSFLYNRFPKYVPQNISEKWGSVIKWIWETIKCIVKVTVGIQNAYQYRVKDMGTSIVKILFTFI